ncbi:hypothetical protein [Polynucleobacter yangtzensis]|uniref:Uncharacterized protein n=1 Tax=Polynucleobacter yangtzensis TaxID=1743159 RepID=A0ABM8CMP9_9BURK|nr:hypothetical protein [Polynucleobacter yangtzensis]BDT79155.1 hypothetical protein PKF032_10430 [Polynucleobacter yangtzensis]
MTIKQFNATYLANDDRLLFRFNTSEDSEFRFWFTRRVTLFILAATSHLLVKALEQSHTPEAAKAIAEFSEEAVKKDREQSEAVKPETYEPASTYPLGADPVLVMDVKCALEKQGSEDMLSLDLVLPGGANINLKMAGPTLQAMCLLLNQLREHAAWGEVPQVQDVATTAAENPQKPQKPLMH